VAAVAESLTATVANYVGSSVSYSSLRTSTCGGSLRGGDIGAGRSPRSEHSVPLCVRFGDMVAMVRLDGSGAAETPPRREAPAGRPLIRRFAPPSPPRGEGEDGAPHPALRAPWGEGEDGAPHPALRATFSPLGRRGGKAPLIRVEGGLRPSSGASRHLLPQGGEGENGAPHPGRRGGRRPSSGVGRRPDLACDAPPATGGPRTIGKDRRGLRRLPPGSKILPKVHPRSTEGIA
jgi:hypothetical protein